MIWIWILVVAVTWTVAAFVLAVLIGRSIRLADVKAAEAAAMADAMETAVDPSLTPGEGRHRTRISAPFETTAAHRHQRSSPARP